MQEGLRFRAVELSVDFVSVEKTIKKGLTDSCLGRVLIIKICRSLKMDWNDKVSHSYEEAN